MQQLFVMILAESKAFAETHFTYIKHQLTCPVVHSYFSIARFSGKPKSCYLDFSTVELNFLSYGPICQAAASSRRIFDMKTGIESPALDA